MFPTSSLLPYIRNRNKHLDVYDIPMAWPCIWTLSTVQLPTICEYSDNLLLLENLLLRVRYNTNCEFKLAINSPWKRFSITNLASNLLFLLVLPLNPELWVNISAWYRTKNQWCFSSGGYWICILNHWCLRNVKVILPVKIVIQLCYTNYFVILPSFML